MLAVVLVSDFFLTDDRHPSVVVGIVKLVAGAAVSSAVIGDRRCQVTPVLCLLQGSDGERRRW